MNIKYFPIAILGLLVALLAYRSWVGPNSEATESSIRRSISSESLAPVSATQHFVYKSSDQAA